MIYLDHNATTPLDERVLEAMLPYLREQHGNPSCAHAQGRAAKRAVDDARRCIGDLLGAAPDEVIFTSGGSEANNLAIKGILAGGGYKGRHVLIGAAEHPSVSKAARQLEKDGYRVEEIPVDGSGMVTPEALRAAITPETVFISIMHAQNEVGTVNNILELCEVIGSKRILFHTDAAQSCGKIPTSFPLMGPNLMTIVGHKLYGPKGIGALIANRGLKIIPQIAGAGQEHDRRAGTENVAAIVGLAKAIELTAGYTLQVHGETITALRDYFHLKLAKALPGVVLNGHRKQRLPTTLNLSFLGLSSAKLAEAIGEEIIVGTGAACHDRKQRLSGTFRAMGLGEERGLSSLRLSLGKDNTVPEIDRAVLCIVGAVESLREKAGCSEFEPSIGPSCPRCDNGLRVFEHERGPGIACQDEGCRHLIPLPGTGLAD